jgi:alanine dehydrogenase
MRVGVPKEIKDNEFPVELIPSVARELTEHGHLSWSNGMLV